MSITPPSTVSTMTSEESTRNREERLSPTCWCPQAYISVSVACVSGIHPTELSHDVSYDLHSKQLVQSSRKVFWWQTGACGHESPRQTPANGRDVLCEPCWGSIRLHRCSRNSPDNMLSFFMEGNFRVISCLCRWIIRWSSVWNRCWEKSRITEGPTIILKQIKLHLEGPVRIV